ncbi:hypothetical protein DL766_006805 [Monosporascus sp. MC13-8B]|uniref:Protein kinase domain-containing protein n=1 Tax=Monosporascus cannonballus TaxID=155416 RepID=A0ABY0GW23_9PEZI|nr:hypothetical protein DL762_008482 [Monosporascus cannonballus]RYO90988.1 hypothetical protein DL763_005159 [Monosporascus cannonballus]RYP26132.1 hypothetical protein DL766_006805 [Monosporascus sp. MC13-8B]
MRRSNTIGRAIPSRGGRSSKRFHPRWCGRWLRCALATALLGILYLTYLSLYYRRELRAKYSPTKFGDAVVWEASRSEAQPTRDGIGGTPDLRDKRDGWERIGGGFEGDVYVYNDTVIKTFVTSRSPLRNCINHLSASTRIPTEIPAMLLLGGRGDHVAQTARFMPVKDYFLKPSADTEPASWHLLMPFLRGGNLKKLAQRLRSAGSAYQDLDDRFRPSFNRVLAALETMHSGHGLCHDDIKPENIFVDSASAGGAPSDTHWLLADFGNVREPAHPYHSTRIWTRHSNQNADCRVNDAVRLVKTYVTFLRLASSDEATFDAAFWAGAEPWSELYWSAAGDPIPGAQAARVLREKSVGLPPLRGVGPVGGEGASEARGLGCRLRLWRCPAQRTPRELRRGLFVTETRARLVGATWIFGLPSGEC